MKDLLSYKSLLLQIITIIILYHNNKSISDKNSMNTDMPFISFFLSLIKKSDYCYKLLIRKYRKLWLMQ